MTEENFYNENEEIEALKEAIQLNRENLLDKILGMLGYTEFPQDLYQELLDIIRQKEKTNIKLTKALEAQEIINKVLKKDKKS